MSSPVKSALSNLVVVTLATIQEKVAGTASDEPGIIKQTVTGVKNGVEDGVVAFKVVRLRRAARIIAASSDEELKAIASIKK